MTILERTQAITGFSYAASGTVTTTQLDQFILDAIVDIVGKLLIIAPDAAKQFGKTDKDLYDDFTIPSGIVLSVERENGNSGEKNTATMIDPGLAFRSTDVNSIHYVGKSNPVWYWNQSGDDNKKIRIIPTTSNSAGEKYDVRYIHYSNRTENGVLLTNTVDIDLDPIAYFPKSLQHLIPVYSSIRSP
jgi:hypothetical protein